jgi:hypothetical protein
MKMKPTIRNVTSRTVDIKRGTYGPAHDPYSFSEFSMITSYSNGTEEVVMIHSGLEYLYSVNGKGQSLYSEAGKEEFERLTGMTVFEFPDLIEMVIDRRQRKCPDCGCRRISCHQGYPGETLYICDRCRRFCDCSFDISAVI